MTSPPPPCCPVRNWPGFEWCLSSSHNTLRSPPTVQRWMTHPECVLAWWSSIERGEKNVWCALSAHLSSPSPTTQPLSPWPWTVQLTGDPGDSAVLLMDGCVLRFVVKRWLENGLQKNARKGADSNRGGKTFWTCKQTKRLFCFNGLKIAILVLYGLLCHAQKMIAIV